MANPNGKTTEIYVIRFPGPLTDDGVSKIKELWAEACPDLPVPLVIGEGGSLEVIHPNKD